MNPVILAIFREHFYIVKDSLAKRVHETLMRYPMRAMLFNVDLSWRHASIRAFVLCIEAVIFLIFIKHFCHY